MTSYVVDKINPDKMNFFELASLTLAEISQARKTVSQTFSVTLQYVLCCLLLIPSSYAVLKDLSPSQIAQIDGLLKDEILLAIPQKTNDTIDFSNELIESCTGKINSTNEACEKCATESCDQPSAEVIKKEKKQKLHKVLLPLLFDPLKKTVRNVKLIEKSIGKILKVIGLKDTEKFLKKFGYVVKDLGKGLLKNAKRVVKDVGKGLEKLGKNLANFAKDIGKGLKDSVKKIGKEAKRLGKNLGRALEKVGKGVEKAAKKVIKELPKAIKKITKKVGDIAKKAGKGVVKVVKKVTKPVVKVVKKVSKGVKRRYLVVGENDPHDTEDSLNVPVYAHPADKLIATMKMFLFQMIEYETDSSVGFSEYGEVYVTITTKNGPYRYRSPIPLDAFNLREFAGAITMKVFEKF
ncbi:hypothetical protein KUTeg_004303 [Tegillarca granosa]|uniref:Uncharacterized protein n=1 Tax=Tegillarca granosa TaxID=220873 RepID=A0ABQ9FTA2_TEGGR|nr:hypothetical protein KUTeg_004303 [Tegillarca granosa]